MAYTEDDKKMLPWVPLEQYPVLPDAQSPLPLASGDLAHVAYAVGAIAVQRRKDTFSYLTIERAQIAAGRIG